MTTPEAPPPGDRGPARRNRVPTLTFAEHLGGHASGAVGPSGDFGAGAALGRAQGGSVDTALVVTCDDLPALLADRTRPLAVSGTVDAPALSPEPLEVVAGTLVLLEPDPSAVEAATMRYDMTLRSAEGRTFRFEGVKHVHDGPASRSWRDTTTLFVTLTEGGALAGKGVLRASVGDVAALARSVRVGHGGRRRDGVRLRVEFLRCFLGGLWPFYAGMLDEAGRFPVPPAVPPGLPAPGGRTPDAARWCDAAGTWHDGPVPGACSRLVRYGAGGRGPVLLAPGFAMSAASFALDHPTPSLTRYLLEHGYEVWLFDGRDGIDLPSAWSQSTLDGIATVDWPRAVDEVRRISGSATVQALGHCAGSVTLLMALLSGTEGIRSAVCSQFTLHPVTSTLNRAKAWFRVGPALAALGIARLDPVAPLSVGDMALDVALRPVPVPHGERCNLAVCRWINTIYGMTHCHAQLDDATHRQLPDLFGVGNLTGLEHLLRILQRGRVVDAHGLDRYLPHVDRLDLPLHFLAGTDNHIFRPESTERTMAWLADAFGPAEASRRYSATYLDGYGHLDTLIGRDAATDVFPIVLDQLDAHA